jgi:hypothetical protein
MTLADNLPYLREACKLITASGVGGLLFGVAILSAKPENAYLMADGLILICMAVCFFAGGLWLLLDMDKNTEIDVREKL